MVKLQFYPKIKQKTDPVSSVGAIPMHNLLAKHGKKKVVVGPLKEATYDSISLERLRKAAKRYTGDAEFQKFAKAYILLHDLQGEEEEPVPCLPLVPKANASQDAKVASWKSDFWMACKRWWQLQWFRWLFLILVLAVMLRPAFSSIVARMFVASLRLTMRRVMSLLAMILEGIVDELIYQLEYTLRGALPNDVSLQETARHSYQFLSHIFASAIGASITFVVSLRRGQVQA